MREIRMTMPELALIAGTRGMLGAGFGLLLADRLSEGQRKSVGWTLMLVGVLTTIPLAIEVFGAIRAAERTGRAESSPELAHAYVL
ncbi:hypothetical protein V5E97_09460 [Singulisphaera sp. Ch08]|uniref:Uncharacterized protein n=1 Tax=Singulisphaera sp. Ch08 TaxID=3120278 RepID=A0AAU7CMG1_9BACT